MAKAIERAKIEGLHKDNRILNKDDVFYNDLQGFALSKLNFYQCFKCRNSYFGGMHECGDGP